MNADLAMDTVDNACERRTYTVSEIARLLGISSNAAYELVKEELFKSVRLVRRYGCQRSPLISG